MALDSAAKRQAVPGAGRPWMRGQSPSAGKGREWRSSVGVSYPVADFQGAPVGGQPFYIRDSYGMPDFLGNQQS